jgi:type I restriction enzyme, S subunit
MGNQSDQTLRKDGVLMAIKPGYKQTELGIIPEDWRIATIGNLGTVGRGRVISHRDIARSKSPLYPVYSSQTSDNGVLGYLDTYDFDGEFITWTTDGANAGTVFPRNGKFNCTNVCGTIKLTSDDYIFVSKVLGTFAPRYVSRHLGNPKLMNNIVKSIYIPLPPTIIEQEAVAEALSDTDALIESLEQLIAKKRLIKQGTMQALLTGNKRLAGFSGDWEVKTLGELLHFSGGLSASRDQLSTEGFCYLHYGDIHLSTKTFIDVLSEYQAIPKLNIPLNKVSRSSLLDDGDIVFVDASEDDEGTSRHVVIINKNNIPFISGLHTIVAKNKTTALDQIYSRFCFQTTGIKRQFYYYSVGTKVSGISKTNIAKILIPVPKLSEQIAIGAMLSDMDEEIIALESKLFKFRQLKQGMMQELLTGRIRLV